MFSVRWLVLALTATSLLQLGFAQVPRCTRPVADTFLNLQGVARLEKTFTYLEKEPNVTVVIQKTTSTFDRLGRQTSIEFALSDGHVWQTETRYVSPTQIKETTRQFGNIEYFTTYNLNTQGLVYEKLDFSREQTLTGRETFTYDLGRRLLETRVINRDGSVGYVSLSCGYDAKGNLVSENSKTKIDEYDAYEEFYDDYSFTSNGEGHWVVSYFFRQNADETRISFSRIYNRKGLLLRSNKDGKPETRIEYIYDSRGNPIESREFKSVEQFGLQSWKLMEVTRYRYTYY